MSFYTSTLADESNFHSAIFLWNLMLQAIRVVLTFLAPDNVIVA